MKCDPFFWTLRIGSELPYSIQSLPNEKTQELLERT
jgi:hypothetical protein